MNTQKIFISPIQDLLIHLNGIQYETNCDSASADVLRTTSGKVLMPFVGKPVLSHIVERLSYYKRIDQIIVATSDQESDNPIHDFCDLNNINCYRGNLNDVLDRYYCAAKA